MSASIKISASSVSILCVYVHSGMVGCLTDRFVTWNSLY